MRGKTLFMMIGIAVMIVFFIGSWFVDLNGKHVDCFDGYRNKIIGKQCVVSNSFDSRIEIVFFLTFSGFLMAILLIMLGTLLDDCFDNFYKLYGGKND